MPRIFMKVGFNDKSMNRIYLSKMILPISIIPLMTSCYSLTDSLGTSNSQTTTTIDTTTETSIDLTTTLEDETLLLEFTDYTYFQNDDGTFNFTITQEAMEGCYYIISVMYDGNVIEFVEGDGYLKSEYGLFADETLEETSNADDEQEYQNDDADQEEVTTTDDSYKLSEEKIKSLMGKEGCWTFRCISEGTQYVEIKLINEYGDVRYKLQFTCIVDTHLEPHLYYTNINY
ncbi:MAG: hypothetical protein LIO71_00485 [Ruminococcus sp.]|nr:hypothetical protein [Ruminococcus sp.]